MREAKSNVYAERAFLAESHRRLSTDALPLGF